MSDLKNKRIITIATTGAWPTKENNPNVPLQPREIADDIYACWKAGASIAHIHVRNDQNQASMEFEKFRQTVEYVRAFKDCDIILNLTTSGGINLTEDDRIRPFVELHPEMASYDVGTMNWAFSAVFDNNPKFLERLGRLMQEHKVKPEVEAFNPAMIYDAAYYLKKGWIQAPVHFQFCMGVANGVTATTKNLVA
ncbi:MAG: 3-keto-5-aminohexanoate cleavage protein, partial [Clostridia bacterium]|nr:3-keto-5-aminohexanoate cleavage protein [Clostridia bacterium]